VQLWTDYDEIFTVSQYWPHAPERGPQRENFRFTTQLTAAQPQNSAQSNPPHIQKAMLARVIAITTCLWIAA